MYRVNMIVFNERIPAPDDYFELFETTGWNREYQADSDELATALRNSWFSVSAYDSDRLIGFGRVVSDGVLHAIIYDMIVRPDHQNQGIGTEILSRLIARCRKFGIRDIQLFAASNKAPFYHKFGFTSRPHDAPGMEFRSEKWQHLRNAFNRSADVYDRIRPGYPTALIDDVIILSGIPEHGRILEIGCATGKATELFASTGFIMDCLDIGSDLAAVAAAKFREFDNIRVIVSPFEDWKPDGQLYDLIIAATSFHWVDPAVAYVKSAALLKPAGALAVFSNKHVQNNEGFFSAVQEVYRNFAPSMTNTAWNEEKNPQTLQGEEHFEEPILRNYPWSMEYSSSQYIDLLSTYSDHINLPDAERNALFTGIANMINREYGGYLLKHYEAVLTLRRKKY